MLYNYYLKLSDNKKKEKEKNIKKAAETIASEWGGAAPNTTK